MSERLRRRALIEDLFAGAISYLESCATVCEVKLCSRSGVPITSIGEWEKNNYPSKLPKEYKNLLMVSNGIEVDWSVKLKGKIIPVGSMRISSLDALIQVDSVWAKSNPKLTTQSHPALESKPCVGYVFHDCQAFGKTAMIYKDKDATEPEVWFQTMDGTWNFLAASFMTYYRLMIAHLGIFGWQYAFADVGLPWSTQAWLSFYAPERADAYSLVRSQQTLQHTHRYKQMVAMHEGEKSEVIGKDEQFNMKLFA